MYFHERLRGQHGRPKYFVGKNAHCLSSMVPNVLPAGVWEVLVAQLCHTLCNSQAPLSVESSWQEYWSGQPFPSPGGLPNPGIEPRSPILQMEFLAAEPQGKSKLKSKYVYVQLRNAFGTSQSFKNLSSLMLILGNMLLTDEFALHCIYIVLHLIIPQVVRG